jgi:hypothetical protein
MPPGHYAGAAGMREGADEHTLLKVERLAKKKNLEGISFSSFSDSRIISNLGRLVINTNTSGVTRLKNLEVDRLVVCANKNNKVNANDLLSDDEREEKRTTGSSQPCWWFPK